MLRAQLYRLMQVICGPLNVFHHQLNQLVLIPSALLCRGGGRGHATPRGFAPDDGVLGDLLAVRIATIVLDVPFDRQADGTAAVCDLMVPTASKSDVRALKGASVRRNLVDLFVSEDGLVLGFLAFDPLAILRRRVIGLLERTYDGGEDVGSAVFLARPGELPALSAMILDQGVALGAVVKSDNHGERYGLVLDLLLWSWLSLLRDEVLVFVVVAVV
ncbi:hypothetical protein BKA81DRAFT_382887 [Phyllosticta paracitricarpa]